MIALVVSVVVTVALVVLFATLVGGAIDMGARDGDAARRKRDRQ
jgi:hypothetical protein